MDVQSTPSNWDRISPPLPTPHAYHIHVEEQMGSSPTGCPVFMVTSSSSPSHKFAGALGSSSSSSLSGHPGPLFDSTVMVVKYSNNQGGTQNPSLCRKAISLLARYERRKFGWGRGTCSWCDHAHHGCSFSFREACAVRSVCEVLPGM